jgi:thymidylate kinase
MIKRIIIEGADQQGKTTLREILAEKLGWNVMHFGKPYEGFDFIKDYRLPEHTISDRNFLSEVVYSRINGKKSRAASTFLCNMHKHDGTLFILMDREKDFVFDNTREEAYDEAAIKLAIYYYREEFLKLNIEKMRLNPNCPAFDKHVQSIIDLVNDSI